MRLPTKFALWFLLFLLLSRTAQAEDKVKKGVLEWKWTKKERKAIKVLAEKVTEKDGYRYLENPNWHIKTELSAQFTAEAATYMELFYDSFCQVFYFKTGLDLDVKPTFYILRSRERYLEVSKAPEWTGGLYRFGYNTFKNEKGEIEKKYYLNLYVYLNKFVSDDQDFACEFTPLNVIQHEGTHCLLAHLLGDKYFKFPVWLNEGMATYYEYWDLRVKASDEGNSDRDIRARKKRLERSPTPIELKKYFEKHGDTPPKLSYLSSLNTQKEWSEELSRETIHLHYALAESFADLMICSRGRREMLKTMFDRLCKDEPLLTAEELDDLEKEWHKRLRKRWDVDIRKTK